MCIPLQTKHPKERIKSVKVFLNHKWSTHMQFLHLTYLHMFIKCVPVCVHKYVPYVTPIQHVFYGECHNVPN